MNWAAFWQIVLWTALIGYFGLAVVISIGGFGDVRRMFRRLASEMHDQAGPPSA